MAERILQIWKVHGKYHLLPHVLVALALCLVAPFVMGVENLNEYQVVKILELFFSLLGIILIMPLFLPDQDKSIRDLLFSKKASVLPQILLRLILQLIILIVLIGGFLLYLKSGNCTFHFMRCYLGVITSCLMLGGLGIFFYGITDNVAVGYMVPVLYYIICYSGASKILGKFYLFSMLNGNWKDKYWLFAAAFLLMTIGIMVHCCAGKVLKTR